MYLFLFEMQACALFIVHIHPIHLSSALFISHRITENSSFHLIPVLIYDKLFTRRETSFFSFALLQSFTSNYSLLHLLRFFICWLICLGL